MRLPGLQACFAAHAEITPSSPPLDDGGNVSRWGDFAYNGNDASQSTGDNQPNYIASGINGLPLLRFTRANSDHLSTATSTGLFSGWTELTLYLVLQGTDTTNDGYIFNNHTGADYRSIIVSSKDPGTGVYLRNSGGQTRVDFGTTAAVMDGSPHICTLHWDGTTMTPYLDGVAGTTGSLASPLRSGTETINIGARQQGSNAYDGDVAEIIAYSVAHSSGELSLVHDYLTARYGV